MLQNTLDTFKSSTSKLKFFKLAALGTVGLCALMSASTARAVTYTVTSTADTEGACGFDCTLRQAINTANSTEEADIIEFATAGTFRLLKALPDLKGNLTIRNTQSANVIISGDASGDGQPGANDVRVFFVEEGAEVTIERLTISGGYVFSDFGGGIYNKGTLNLTNSTVAGNRAEGRGAYAYAVGGGICNDGTLTITNSTLANNTVAVYGDSSKGNDYVRGGNANGLGGGIYSYGTLIITSSTLSGNSVVN